MLAYQVLAVTLILRPFGNLCLAWGTKHFSQVLALNPVVYLRAMVNPFVAAGIVVLILATLLRIALLSLADLSFIVPLTATGYIISTLLGKFFLREQITISRWAGILLIFAGTVIVSSTSQKTAVRVELLE
jgi:drug/metabolite transporter (DMT)-like permease